MKMQTFLFFDDQWLVGRDNLERKYGQPKLIRDSVYKDPNVNTPVCFNKVFFDEKTGKYILFYNGFKKGTRETGLFTAESDDGIHWTPRNVAEQAGVVNPIAPNHCVNGVDESVSMIYDKKNERYVLLANKTNYGTTYDCQNIIYTSKDGIKFENTGITWHKTLMGCEPLGGVFYNPLHDNYVINCRPIWGDRRVCIVETDNFEEFTEPELILQVDSLDPPCCDIQGMSAFYYDGYFIGILYPYFPPMEPKDKSVFGKVNSQLAYSLNGRSFQRSLRTPFIGNGEPGDPTYGMVWPDNVRVADNDKIYITATACTLEHGFWEKYGTGSIVTYELRKDGFICLEPSGGVGRLCTRCVYYDGGDFTINVEAPEGFATCAFYDDNVTDFFRKPIDGFSHEDCVPFTGDSTSWTPQFKEHSVEELKDKVFMIEIKLTNGRLYAIRGNFRKMMATEVFQYNYSGKLPDRQGF